MKLFIILKVALRALRRNKMRTILTMLGMIIGVGAVIMTVSFGVGAKAQVEAQIASLTTQRDTLANTITAAGFEPIPDCGPLKAWHWRSK